MLVEPRRKEILAGNLAPCKAEIGGVAIADHGAIRQGIEPEIGQDRRVDARHRVRIGNRKRRAACRRKLGQRLGRAGARRIRPCRVRAHQGRARSPTWPSPDPAYCERRDLVLIAQGKALPQPLVIPEDKSLALSDRAARRRAKLIAAKCRNGRPIEWVTPIEGAVAQKLIGAAMECVGSRPRDGADDPARRPSVLRREICGQDLELRHRIHAQIPAEDAPGRLVRVIVDARPIQEIVILLRPASGDGQLLS